MKILYRIGWWLQEVVKLILVALVIFSVASGGWQYRFVDGHTMRAFTIKLPGYEEYTDWDHGNIAIRRVFSLRALYRIGPWIEPEWVEDDAAP